MAFAWETISRPTEKSAASAATPRATAPPGYLFQFDRSVEISPPGVAAGGGITGNEVRILADGTLQLVPALQGIEVTSDGLSELTILGLQERDFSTWVQENFTGLEIRCAHCSQL